MNGRDVLYHVGVPLESPFTRRTPVRPARGVAMSVDVTDQVLARGNRASSPWTADRGAGEFRRGRKPSMSVLQKVVVAVVVVVAARPIVVRICALVANARIRPTDPFLRRTPAGLCRPLHAALRGRGLRLL